MHIFLIYKKGPLWCGWSCSWIAGHCKVTVSRRMRGVLVWSLCYIREGNGTPLQYSWLANPTDRGAWWAAVHGVTRSRTGLSDFTFTFHFSLLCIGEGNGNPLQCSCLENSRDGGAWWAVVHGVTRSQTGLKQLSSSSSSSYPIL